MLGILDGGIYRTIGFDGFTETLRLSVPGPLPVGSVLGDRVAADSPLYRHCLGGGVRGRVFIDQKRNPVRVV